jgi:hypothetical protein
MPKSTRRDLFKVAAGGSLAAGLGWGLTSAGASGASAQSQNRDRGDDNGHGDHDHSPVNGPLATAVVSFGQWPTSPPVDRHPNLSPLDRNGHQVIPHEVTVKAGGTVNYIIAGLHQIAVYDRGIRPQNINTALLVPPAGGGPPILIDDPEGRLYRGLDPTVLPILSVPPPPLPPPNPPQVLADRVEVVHFPRPGRYLVICTVLPHFVNDNMYGWVRVVR